MTTNTKIDGLSKSISFDFDFGASARYDTLDQWQREATGYTITIGYDRRKATFDYFTGPAITDDPDLRSVMACLVSDASAGEQTFPDFCSDFGYDEDSRRAYSTWEQCQRSADKLRHLFGSDLPEILAFDWDI